MRVLNIFRPPLVAIDVGTAVTRVSFGSGGVLERPSVVRETVHGSEVVRPAMRDGVVADIAGVAGVVHELLEHRRRPLRQRPAAVVCAPTDASEPEREALVEAVAVGGASVVAVVPEPLAAAVGAGVDIASEYATALLDIGDGVTDFAIFRDGTIVRSHAKRIGCGTLRAAIHEWLELRHGLDRVPGDTIETIVRAYCRSDVQTAFAIPGARVALEREDLETLLDPLIDSIATFLATTMRELPDELAAEIIESGIHITGGGAYLDRLVRKIESDIGLPLTRASDPLHAVIRGAGEMLRAPHLRQSV